VGRLMVCARWGFAVVSGVLVVLRAGGGGFSLHLPVVPTPPLGCVALCHRPQLSREGAGGVGRAPSIPSLYPYTPRDLRVCGVGWGLFLSGWVLGGINSSR